MEIERLKVLKREEELDRIAKEKRLEGKRVIVEQIQARHQARMKDVEFKEREAT